MKLAIVLLALPILIGCTEPPSTSKTKDFNVPIKMCVDACIGSQFENFHTHPSTWGTGTSSMNGLQESKIYEHVISYCEKFYVGEKCCEGDAVNTWGNIRTVHGYHFGVCKE